MIFIRALLLGAALLGAAPVMAAQALVYDCRGAVSQEPLFGSGATERQERRWQLEVNDEAGYVKRGRELAAGCVQRTVEICGCELGAELIRCRSLGITPEGNEVGMDFTLDRRSLRLQLSGQRVDPSSGAVVETRGELACEGRRR